MVDSNSGEKSVPIILEVQSETSNFALSLSASPGSKQLSPGENLIADILIVNIVDVDSHLIDYGYILDYSRLE